MRYQEGQISEEAFEQLMDSEGIKKLASAAVWKDNGQMEITAEDTAGRQKTNCFSLKGQPEAVFGKTLQSGRYFLSSEEGVCLLDQKSAIALFGVKDASGNEIGIGEKRYRITGILSGEDAICIIPAEKGSAFDGVTVRRKSGVKSVQSIVNTLEVYLGGSHEEPVDGQFYSATARIIFAVNLALLCAALCTGASVFARKTWKPAVLSQILCAAGWILPLIIIIYGIAVSGLGRDYLPTYRSDFEFFSSLLKTKAEAVRMLAASQQFWLEQRLFSVWRQVVEGGAVMAGLTLLGMLYGKISLHHYKRMEIVR